MAPSPSCSMLSGPILPVVLRLAAPNVVNVAGVLTILVVDAFCFVEVRARSLDTPGPRPNHGDATRFRDRKSTRLNSSHIQKSRMPSSA